MFDVRSLLSLVVIFTLTILYGFTYIEILFMVHKIFYKEEYDPPEGLITSLLCVSLLLFATSYVARIYILNFDLFFVSLGLFFTSVTLFALGLKVRKTWEQKIQEMNIKLLSVYSLWIIQGIYLLAVIICFLLALVSLIEYIYTVF